MSCDGTLRTTAERPFWSPTTRSMRPCSLTGLWSSRAAAWSSQDHRRRLPGDREPITWRAWWVSICSPESRLATSSHCPAAVRSSWLMSATGPAYVAFAPAAVALFARRPEGSPRNVWPGLVSSLEPHGAGVRVEIAGAPDAGSSILAEITPAAVAELGHRPGKLHVGGGQSLRHRHLSRPGGVERLTLAWSRDLRSVFAYSSGTNLRSGEVMAIATNEECRVRMA